VTALAAIPARLAYSCGHVALVSLAPKRGETPRQRRERVEQEKAAALLRSCDFCGPAVAAVDGQVNGLLNDSNEPASASGSMLVEVDGVVEAIVEAIETTSQEPQPEAAPIELPEAPAARETREAVPESVSEPVLVEVQAPQPEPEPEIEAVVVVVPEPTPPLEPVTVRREPATRRRPAPRQRPAATRARPRTTAEAAPAPPARPARRTATGPSPAERRRYLVTFRAEPVIEADSLSQALAQAEALGAIDIYAVVRLG